MRQVARILDVSRKEQVEGRAVANLCVEIAGRSVIESEVGLAMLSMELASGFGEDELQVGRGGDGEFTRRGWVAARRAQKREQNDDGARTGR